MKKGRWLWIPVGLVLLMLSACGTAEQAEDAGSGEDAVNEEDAVNGEDAVKEEDTVNEEEGLTDAVTDSAREEAAEETDGGSENVVTDENNEMAVEPDVKGTVSLSILGDSISTFEGWIPEGNSVFYPQNGMVQDVSRTWWKIVLDETGFALCVNGSSSGSTCRGDSLASDPMIGCSDFRIGQLEGADGKAPDVIIVYMGTNDVVESIPIGGNDGTKPVEEGYVDQFSDAYTLILNKLEERYPMARIYCCTLLPVGDWGTQQPFVPFVNGVGLTSEAYSDQIRTIAQNRGIPVIDLYYCGITIDNMSEMTSDGVHLTPEGMRCVAEAVLECIVK